MNVIKIVLRYRCFLCKAIFTNKIIVHQVDWFYPVFCSNWGKWRTLYLTQFYLECHPLSITNKFSFWRMSHLRNWLECVSAGVCRSVSAWLCGGDSAWRWWWWWCLAMGRCDAGLSQTVIICRGHYMSAASQPSHALYCGWLTSHSAHQSPTTLTPGKVVVTVGGRWAAYTGSYNIRVHDRCGTSVMANMGDSSTKNNKS